MRSTTIAEAPIVHPEPQKAYDRQEGESAKWYWRFRNYLNLGPKRSINATFELERKEKPTKTRTKAGPEWYGAANRFQWLTRADIYDRDQDEQKAALMRAIAMRAAFVSRPFRLAQLNAAADTLMRELEKGQEPEMFLALTKQLQSLLHDIKAEVDEWGLVTDSACDAAALDAWEQKGKRMDALQRERDEILDEELDHMLIKFLQMDPTLLPEGASAEEAIAFIKETGAHARIAKMAQLRGMVGARMANKVTATQ